MTIEQGGVIVALDHGLTHGVLEGFEDPRDTLRTILTGNPDGILCSVAFLRAFDDELAAYPEVDLIVTLDQIQESTLPGESEDAEVHQQVCSVSEAARLGADHVKTALVYGRTDKSVLEGNIQFVADVSATARSYGMSSVVETALWGNRIDDELDVEWLANANRYGFELGADVLKTFYPGESDAFARIAGPSPLPVYIAGGPRVSDDTAVLEMVSGALDGGAKGVMFGRNIWQHDSPAAMIQALKDIVHDDAGVHETAVALD